MKLLNILAIDVVAVALLATTISVFGCNNDSATTSDVITEQVESPVDVPVQETKPAPTPEPAGVPAPSPAREVTYGEAEAAYQERNYREAATLFTAYLEAKPDNPWGHYMLGLSARKSDDFETAEQAFKRALELDPKHVKSMLNLSRVYLDTGQAEDALEQLYEVFEFDPQSGVAYRLQGRALHQLGDTTDAIHAYRDAILIDSSDGWAINNLGLIYIEQGRFEEALPALARAVELNESAAVIRNNLGIALENTGHFRAAEEAYRAAVELDANIESANRNLARVMEVVEDSSIEAVDLPALAQAFINDCQTWVASLEPVTEEDSIEEESSNDAGLTPIISAKNVSTEDAIGK